MELAKEFEKVLTEAVGSTGEAMEKTKEDVAEYMSARALHLSEIASEPGFDRAVAAEARNVQNYAVLRINEFMNEDGHSRFNAAVAAALRMAAVSML